MLRFNNENLLGYHENVEPAPPELQAVRRQYFGLGGTSEVVGRRGGRRLRVRAVLVNAPSSVLELNLYLAKIDLAVGSHGDLVLIGPTGSQDRVWRHCTFEGFEHEPVGGRLGPFVDFDYGAWTVGFFYWYQLSIEDDLPEPTGPGGGKGGKGG